jgi:hypothetical protein
VVNCDHQAGAEGEAHFAPLSFASKSVTAVSTARVFVQSFRLQIRPMATTAGLDSSKVCSFLGFGGDSIRMSALFYITYNTVDNDLTKLVHAVLWVCQPFLTKGAK